MDGVFYFSIMDACFMQALEFASMQNDDEVWEELIKQSTQRPEMVL